jgi:hypothetical protein
MLYTGLILLFLVSLRLHIVSNTHTWINTELVFSKEVHHKSIR